MYGIVSTHARSESTIRQVVSYASKTKSDTAAIQIREICNVPNVNSWPAESRMSNEHISKMDDRMLVKKARNSQQTAIVARKWCREIVKGHTTGQSPKKEVKKEEYEIFKKLFAQKINVRNEAVTVPCMPALQY